MINSLNRYGCYVHDLDPTDSEIIRDLDIMVPLQPLESSKEMSCSRCGVDELTGPDQECVVCHTNVTERGVCLLRCLGEIGEPEYDEDEEEMSEEEWELADVLTEEV
jgi:hypothetical protein